MNPHIWHGIALLALGLAIAITLGVLCAHLEELEQEARRKAKRRHLQSANNWHANVWPEPKDKRGWR